VNECRQIYFRLKDKIFKGMRPYVSETLEKFLQKFVGEETRMCDMSKPRVIVPATQADRFPPSAKFFRNYPSPDELLNSPANNDAEEKTSEELIWRVARATGAAPTYFSQFDFYLDGIKVSLNLSVFCY
jgi:calcium-independent phospholipase A2